MKLPAILSPRPTPDESLFEYRVCPFCRGLIDFEPLEGGADCLECGRHWERMMTEPL